MRDELLYPINEVLASSDFLLQETILNDIQRKFLHSIYTVAHKIQQLIVTTPAESLTIDRVQEIFSYETRELLSSMIGYAEVLDEEGDLDQTQQQYVAHIHTNSVELLDAITNIIE